MSRRLRDLDWDLVIRPHRGWQPVDLREIWRYRELLGFLVWRDVRIRYRQTVLGGLWAVLQPLLAMGIFTVFFHRLGGIRSEDLPYPLFAFSGLVAWMFFSNAVTAASSSLIGNQQLISKVYFPRIFIPLGSIGALVVDLVLNLVMLGLMTVYFRRPVSGTLILLPVFVAGTFLAATGLGLLLSALNVRYRDVKYTVPFLVQMGLFVTPVIYSMREIPERFQLLAALNPMTGMVEGFRLSLLGSPARWEVIGVSLTMCMAFFIVGLYIFRRMERRFADVI